MQYKPKESVNNFFLEKKYFLKKHDYESNFPKVQWYQNRQVQSKNKICLNTVRVSWKKQTIAWKILVGNMCCETDS